MADLTEKAINDMLDRILAHVEAYPTVPLTLKPTAATYVLKTYPTARLWDEELGEWRAPSSPSELEANRRINASMRNDILEMLPGGSTVIEDD